MNSTLAKILKEEIKKETDVNLPSLTTYSHSLVISIAKAYAHKALEEAAEKENEAVKVPFGTQWELKTVSTRFKDKDGIVTEVISWGINTPEMYTEGFKTPNDAIKYMKNRLSLKDKY